MQRGGEAPWQDAGLPSESEDGGCRRARVSPAPGGALGDSLELLQVFRHPERKDWWESLESRVQAEPCCWRWARGAPSMPVFPHVRHTERERRQEQRFPGKQRVGMELCHHPRVRWRGLNSLCAAWPGLQGMVLGCGEG